MGGAVVAGDRGLDHGELLLLVEEAGAAHGGRALVDTAGPFEQQRVLDGLVEGRPVGDGAVVRQQGGASAVERGEYRLGEFGVPNVA